MCVNLLNNHNSMLGLSLVNWQAKPLISKNVLSLHKTLKNV
jgi:hypothetical protein